MTGDKNTEFIPRFVDAILDWRWTGFCARLALVSAYILGGFAKTVDFPGAVAEQAHFGMKPPAFWAVLSILAEFLGPALILSGRYVWLGTGMLGVFTGFAALKANAFWMMEGQERFAATNAFFEHIGLIGGFVLVAMIDQHHRRGGRPNEIGALASNTEY